MYNVEVTKGMVGIAVTSERSTAIKELPIFGKSEGEKNSFCVFRNKLIYTMSIGSFEA